MGFRCRSALQGETRRGDLTENVIQADDLADTTIRLYNGCDAYGLPQVNLDEVQSICKFNKVMQVTYCAPKWSWAWRDNDGLFPYQSRQPFSSFKVPACAIETALARHVEDFE